MNTTARLRRPRSTRRTLLNDLKGDMDSSGMGDDLRELKRELEETRRMASQAMRGESESKVRPSRTPREDTSGDEGVSTGDAQGVDSSRSGDSLSSDSATSDPATTDTATGDATSNGALADGGPTPGPPLNGATRGAALAEDPSIPRASTNGTQQSDPDRNGDAPSSRPVAGWPITGPGRRRTAGPDGPVFPRGAVTST